MLFIIFWSALFAWVLGLSGGRFIKGIQQMAFLTFVVQVKLEAGSTLVPALAGMIQECLEKGYKKGIPQLFGNTAMLPSSKIAAGTNFDTDMRKQFADFLQSFIP